MTAVVVTYNSIHHIDRLLDSIPAAAGGVDVDVIVVDNSSVDGTLDRVATRGDCRVISAPNRGYAAGINVGARLAPTDSHLLILNPDLVLGPGAIAAMVARLGGSIGIVGPTVRGVDGHVQWSQRRDPTIARTLGLARTGSGRFQEYVTDLQAYGVPGQVDWVLGAVLLVSSQCRAVVGDWDESFFLYSEETDYCLRARELGFATWFEPAAEAVHVGGGSGQSPKTHAMQIVNRVRLHSRRSRTPSAAAFMVLTLMREVVWLPRTGARGRAAVLALLVPSRRPPELGPTGGVIPR